MKKRLAAILAIAMSVMLALSACGPGSSSNVSPNPGAESASPTVTAQPPESEAPEESETPEESEAPGRDILALADEIEFDPDSYTDIILDIPYMDDGEDYHLLNLYGTQSDKNPTPTVIEVHGGGFVGGSRANNAGHSIFFAERGYKVVVPDYSKIPRHGDFRDAIRELFTVYHWVEENADTYGFDLNNVFLSGDSAGGYYVLLSCAIFQSAELQEYYDVTLPGYTFNTYVTTCPMSDIRSMRDDLSLESGPAAHMAQTIGEELLMDDDLMDHLDLMMNVAPEAFTGIYKSVFQRGKVNTQPPPVSRF